MPGRNRSTKSHLVELLLALALVLAIWLFVANGGAAWAGQLLADQFARPRP